MDQSDTYEQLVQQYKHATTESHKARLENDLWEVLSSQERRRFKSGRRTFLKEVLGVGPNAAGDRCYLFSALHSDLLWPRVDRGAMGRTTAVRLHREARTKSRDKNDLRLVLIRKLKEYDALPSRAAPGDKVVKYAPTRSHTVKAITKTGNFQKMNSRQFWSQLRVLIGHYMKSELPQTDIVEDRFWSAFETDISTAIADFKRRVVTAKKKRAEREPTSHTRRQIRTAFETLCLDVPRKGKPIDMKSVNKNKRRLARMYHPDANGGDEGMREAYQAVLAAAALIEELAQEQE